MRLDLEITNVRSGNWGAETAVRDGVLFINRAELEKQLAQDRNFASVSVDLALPGDSARIIKVWDVLEPRAKVSGGPDFPGILSTFSTQGVGSGVTRALRGAGIVITDQTIPDGGNVNLIDMSGPAAPFTDYAKLVNVVLTATPAAGVSPTDYRAALRIASAKMSVYLARAAANSPADAVEVYELPALAQAQEGMEHLPRVVYIYQIHSHQFPAAHNEPVIYGENSRQMLPTILHPNEIFDGALVRSFWVRNIETIAIQNHPVVKALYDRHGKDLCFVGVIVLVAGNQSEERDRNAVMAANLAKHVLGADGAVLTKAHGGAPHVHLAVTGDRCEELGIKTVWMVEEQSGGGSAEGSLIFSSPNADALVNVGGSAEILKLPAVERVLGGPLAMGGELEWRLGQITGSVIDLGASRLVAARY